MTTFQLLVKEQQSIGFICKGHSGYAEQGEDIVCAAISSLTQFCISCAEELSIPVQYDKGDALLKCSVTHPDPIFTILLNTLRKNMMQLEEDFPEFIHVEIMEV